MIKLKFIIFIFFALSTFLGKAEIVNIGILHQSKITSFIFSPQFGSYTIYTENGKLAEIENDEIIQLSYSNGEIFVKSLDKDYGAFKKVRFIGTAWENSFKIKTNNPSGKIKFYDDNLLVKVHNYENYFQLINNNNTMCFYCSVFN